MRLSKNVIAYLVILLFSSTACFSGEGESERYGKSARETRDVRNYSGISVSSGIEVVLQIGTPEKVVIEAGEEIIHKVYTEVHDGILEIGIHNSGWHGQSHQSIKAYVTAQQIKSIHSSSGSLVRGTNPVQGQDLELSASSGSSIKLNIKESNLKAEVSSGSEMELSGNTQMEALDASSGGSIKASDLFSDEANARTSSGSEIHLQTKKSLDAHASSGGSIHYRGNPARVSKDKSSGGSIDSE